MSILLLESPEIRRALLPISVEQYHRLSEAGIIAENTELLQGAILRKMTKSPLHTYVVHALVQLLVAALPTGGYVRKKEPLTLADSEPEPDMAVVDGSAEDYRTAHPATAHLVVEVAVASIELDREKATIYAQAVVGEYWIVIPERHEIEIYTDPSPAGYRSFRRVTLADAKIALSRFQGVDIDVRTLLST